MADTLMFYIQDDRSIKHENTGQIDHIMKEDYAVTDWQFRIPKVLNGIDMSSWAWWLVYVNALGNKYTESLTLTDDVDDPSNYMIATYTIRYGMSIKEGEVLFAVKAKNADAGGTVTGEWHTKTYSYKVIDTLQGNEAEYSETESDVISALIVELQTRVRQLVGGAVPTPVSSTSAMTDTTTIYLNTTDGYWYYYNGSAWTAGGVYASGLTVDDEPTENSTNLITSGAVYDLKEDLSADNENILWFSNTITRTYQGITASFDSDGNIILNGTATAKVVYAICGAATTSEVSVPAGTYVFSRELISGTASRNPSFTDGDDNAYLVDTEITLESDTIVLIRIYYGATYTDAKYKFTIRKAGITANDKTARNAIEEKSIRILGIGNSYTRDSVRWLSKILIESGYDKAIVGHGYIGAITLAEQYASLDSTDSNYEAYTYYKYVNNGHQYTKEGKTLEEVITSEPWDVVIFQQQSDEAGQYDSFVSNDFDINDFISYVKTAIGNDDLKIGIALTWSHASGYSGEKFAEYYNSDPATQFEAIKSVIPQVANYMSQCDFIVNVGDAIDYGRNDTYLGTLGTELLRTDKNHLYYGIPSYMAGLVYAMTICGLNGTESTWYPTADDEGVTCTTSANYARIARLCAKKAVAQVL